MLRKFAKFQGRSDGELIAIRADKIVSVYTTEANWVCVTFDDGSKDGDSLNVGGTVEEAVKEIETCLA